MVSRWFGKKIAVLMGGASKERDISIRTGLAISSALKKNGYDVVEIEFKLGFESIDIIRNEKPDVAIIAMHGKYGEDGCVQGLLEILRIPYTGGGVMASSVGMDKAICSSLATHLGIRCPNRKVLNCKDASLRGLVQSELTLPLIVKPAREGSTINMTIVSDWNKIDDAIKLASASDEKMIVEQYIKGKEITVGVLNGKALSPLEIAPKGGFYDFESKYTSGKTEYILPANISDKCSCQLKEWSEEIYDVIECYGTARADFIVDKNEVPYFLEINTIPGMTELSLVPKAAAYDGISFVSICESMLDSASLKS